MALGCGEGDRRAGQGEAVVWSADGRAVAFHDDGRIVTAREPGFAARNVGEGWSTDPVWSPDGRRIAFTTLDGPPEVVWVGDANAEAAPLFETVASGATLRWGDGGRSLLFVDRVDGERFSVLERSLVDGTCRRRCDLSGDHVVFDVSPDGERLAAVFERDWGSILWMDGDCRRLSPGRPSAIAFSPAGDEVAVVRADGDQAHALEIVGVADGSSRLIEGLGRVRGVEWDPQGEWLGLWIDDSLALLEVRGDGVRWVAPRGVEGFAGWSADGGRLAYVRDGELFVARCDGAGVHEPVLEADSLERPRWSPTGSRLSVRAMTWTTYESLVGFWEHEDVALLLDLETGNLTGVVDQPVERFALARLHLRRGEFEAALRALEGLRAPDPAVVSIYRSRCLERLGRWVEAVREYECALAMPLRRERKGSPAAWVRGLAAGRERVAAFLDASGPVAAQAYVEALLARECPDEERRGLEIVQAELRTGGSPLVEAIARVLEVWEPIRDDEGWEQIWFLHLLVFSRDRRLPEILRLVERLESLEARDLVSRAWIDWFLRGVGLAAWRVDLVRDASIRLALNPVAPEVGDLFGYGRK